MPRQPEFGTSVTVAFVAIRENESIIKPISCGWSSTAKNYEHEATMRRPLKRLRELRKQFDQVSDYAEEHDFKGKAGKLMEILDKAEHSPELQAIVSHLLELLPVVLSIAAKVK